MNDKFFYTNNCHKREDNIKEWINSLNKNEVFYDLGANLGWFSLYAASLGLDTYAFEVDKQNFKGLKTNSENLGLKNHHIFNLGVADKKRTVKLRKLNDDVGEHHKTLEVEDFSASEKIISYNSVEEVDVDSLDNLIKINNLPYPDALKVDIDGSEYLFLLGANETLKKANSIVIEIFVKNKFYPKMIEILNSHSFKEIKRYPIPNEDDLYNFLFVKENS